VPAFHIFARKLAAPGYGAAAGRRGGGRVTRDGRHKGLTVREAATRLDEAGETARYEALCGPT
jgi:hypothetical protein